MALKLYCNVCAASLEADDLAIRRGITMCQYCSTVLRITDKGTETFQDEIEHRPLHSDIKVKRKSAGEMIIGVRNFSGVVINKREMNQGCLLGIGVTVLLLLVVMLIEAFLGFSLSAAGGFGVLPVMPGTFVTILVTSVVVCVGILGARKPAIILKKDVVIPTTGSPKIPRENIKQIYATATTYNAKVSDSSARPVTTGNVYALTHDGKRVFLSGLMPDVEAALQVEELIEVELGMFNLPVYGDVSLPKQIELDNSHLLRSVNVEDSLVCEYCGIGIDVTPEEQKKGYVVCECCMGLALLYAPNKEPILGLPQDDFKNGQFRVEQKRNGPVIYPRQGPSTKPIVIVSHGKLHAAQVGGSLRSVKIADVKKFEVREIPYDIDDPKRDTADFTLSNVSNIFKSFQNATAYSGEIDPEKLMVQSLGLDKYQLSVRLQNGQDYWLIKMIDKPKEALFLAKTLEKACRSK